MTISEAPWRMLCRPRRGRITPSGFPQDDPSIRCQFCDLLVRASRVKAVIGAGHFPGDRRSRRLQ